MPGPRGIITVSGNKLKMPGPRGIITVSGNVERSLRAEECVAALAAEH